MNQFKSLKNQLHFLEETDSRNAAPRRTRPGQSTTSRFSSIARYVLFGSFVIAFLLYAGARYGEISPEIANPVPELFSWVDQPDNQLLEDMGAWMEEMGYTGLTREELE